MKVEAALKTAEAAGLATSIIFNLKEETNRRKAEQVKQRPAAAQSDPKP